MMQKLVNGSTPLKVKCIKNDGYVGSLIVGKTYDAFRGQYGAIGVVDEEGECYLYPDGYLKEVAPQ